MKKTSEIESWNLKIKKEEKSNSYRMSLKIKKWKGVHSNLTLSKLRRKENLRKET